MVIGLTTSSGKNNSSTNPTFGSASKNKTKSIVIKFIEGSKKDS